MVDREEGPISTAAQAMVDSNQTTKEALEVSTTHHNGQDGLQDEDEERMESMEEPDTCRICRGEAVKGEPLFFPCKCSGSIKFVHQDCLMEWLSHSQKKHCELCKTPFRFTKLYAPNMPQVLPTFVFVRHFFLHIVRNLGTWLKFCLVVLVWLGCVPYAIRQVWRILFWFSDGGWPSRHTVSDSINDKIKSMAELRRLSQSHIDSLSTVTSPTSPLQAVQTTSSTAANLLTTLLEILLPWPYLRNLTISEGVAERLMESIHENITSQPTVGVEGSVNETISQLSARITTFRRQSLLSEVSIFKNLTAYPSLNQLLISVSEGYIITVLVVVSFVLVFLIREWVVQQQPGLNMGAGFNADLFANQPRNAQADPAAVRGPNEEAQEIVPRPIARLRRRHVQPVNDDPRGEGDLDPASPLEGIASSSRPAMPPRNAIPPPAEIQLTEDFLAIWRRADSDPQEVLRIIEKEGLGERMQYWVNRMQNLVVQSTAQEEPQRRISSPSTNYKKSRRSSDSNEDSADVEDDEPMMTDSTTPVEPFEHEATSSKWKGKDAGNTTFQFSFSVSSKQQLDASGASNSRPRARSDGPQPRGKSSLGNNNWTFATLTKGSLEGSKDTTYNSNETDLASSNTSNYSIDKRPSSPSLKSEAWKAVQEVRVQQAMIRGIQAHQAAAKTQIASIGSDEPKMFLTSEAKGENGCSELYGPNEVVKTPKHGDEVLNTNLVKNDSTGNSGEQFIEPVKAVRHEISSLGETEVDATFESHSPDQQRAIRFDLPPAQSSSSDQPESQNRQTTSDHPIAPDATEGDERHANMDLPAEPEPARLVPQGLLGRIADWLWGIEDHMVDEVEVVDDEQVVEDLDVEAPFVPVGEDFEVRADGAPANRPQDPQVLQAAIAVGLDPNDPEGIDDIEDFDGIMELIGMRGPLFGLVQNALFSTFLLAVTVFFGVWIPYNIGRISLILLANPWPTLIEPLRLLFGLAAFLQDLGIALLGVLSYALVSLISVPLYIWSYFGEAQSSTGHPSLSFGTNALNITGVALGRIADSTIDGLVKISESEIQTFSAASHEALLQFKQSLGFLGATMGSITLGQHEWGLPAMWHQLFSKMRSIHRSLEGLPAMLSRPDSWVISLEMTKRSTPLNLDLSVWGAMDRLWATLAGYASLCILGAIYVQRGVASSHGHAGREWEATVLDLLNQAGGVLKVILIISIEMLVFPLYCGMLLDVALLPLFESATIISRVLFTLQSPLTSIFVHWFVGTCYMFHFALFVSMCRKIMRKGVLYFIRDPDDPNFHPVRDVLERNVITQLRKILFSAVVYGALVIVCLGGVVWGLAYAFQGVLPVHWSSNEPVLEFPIDLLFYNFLMPLAVRFFKPSDGLHSMYSWWFHQCARYLRLTWFLFDERQLDEEGEHVRRNWLDVLRGIKGDTAHMVQTRDSAATFRANPDLNAFYQPTGKYVRAPASDSVRLPKGTQIFIPVDESNNRLDGMEDDVNGVYGRNSTLYKQVYLPPWFRVRVSLFIASIWAYAALTGVCITIVPLVFGRLIFAHIIPSHVRKNDVYAFSIGIYVLGSVVYLVLHLRRILLTVSTYLSITTDTPRHVYHLINDFAIRASRILWTYGAFFFLLPTLFAFVIEFYLILPLHTYFSINEPHIVHFVQSWTLGLLYVKLTTRLILWHRESRPAEALRAIVRNGYFNPDARLATRSFILPVGVCLFTALALPWGIAFLVVTTLGLEDDATAVLVVYRYSYPAVLAIVCWICTLSLMLDVMQGWKQRIKDEAYLIGERLHNFGEGARRSTNTGVGARVDVPGSRRIDA